MLRPIGMVDAVNEFLETLNSLARFQPGRAQAAPV